MITFGGFHLQWSSVAIFLLTIPVSIASNLLTPYVKNLWARTSSARLRRRVRTLRAYNDAIAIYQEDPIEAIAQSIRWLSYLVVDAIQYVVANHFTDTTIEASKHTTGYPKYLLIALIIILIIWSLVIALFGGTHLGFLLSSLRFVSGTARYKTMLRQQKEMAKLEKLLNIEPNKPVDNVAPISETPINPPPSQEKN